LADHIYDSLDFRTGNCRLATVTIPDDEDVYVEMSADTPLFRAERFVIGQVMSFDEGSRVFVAGMFNDRLSYKEGIISKKCMTVCMSA